MRAAIAMPSRAISILLSAIGPVAVTQRLAPASARARRQVRVRALLLQESIIVSPSSENPRCGRSGDAVRRCVAAVTQKETTESRREPRGRRMSKIGYVRSFRRRLAPINSTIRAPARSVSTHSWEMGSILTCAAIRTS